MREEKFSKKGYELSTPFSQSCVKNIFSTWFFLLCFFILFLPSTKAKAADKKLTISQAAELSVKNSDGIRTAKISIVKKEIEISQAIKAIADTRKNESTIRFSLLFNIQFPEKHGMPKEIELLTKVPTLQSELRVLQRKVDYEKLKAKEKAESAFYDVLQKEYELAFASNRLKEAEEGQKAIQEAFAKREAKKTDIEYMEKEVKDAKQAVESANLSLETAKDKLSTILGVNVRYGYRFVADLPKVDFDRSDLSQMKEQAQKKDYNLYEATEKRDVAQSDVDTTSDVYKNYYGSDTTEMLSYIKSCKARGETIDYEAFIKKYNRFLTQIDAPWAGKYTINLIFFKLKIPKEWFKKTYSGTRYLEDESYALFVNLLALEEAESERLSVENELLSSIEDGYDKISQNKRSYQASLLSIASAEQEYNEAREENILGELSFVDLYEKKKSLMDQQKSLYEMQIDYAKSISTLNLQTSGYVEDKLKNQKPNALKTYENGVSTGEQSNNDLPSFWVESAQANRRFVFSVSIPKDYGITHFALFTLAGDPIGEKTKIDQGLYHLSISYADSSILMLKLYRGDEQTHIAYFDGLQYSGTLKLQELSDFHKTGEEASSSETKAKGILAGNYKLSSNGLLTKIKLGSDLFRFDRFELFFEDKLLGEGTYDTGLSLLSVYFGDLNEYRIKLYLEDELMAELNLKPTGDFEGELVYYVE